MRVLLLTHAHTVLLHSGMDAHIITVIGHIFFGVENVFSQGEVCVFKDVVGLQLCRVVFVGVKTHLMSV